LNPVLRCLAHDNKKPVQKEFCSGFLLSPRSRRVTGFSRCADELVSKCILGAALQPDLWI